MTEPRWLTWAKQLQAMSQAGLAYAENHYDRERYAELRRVAAEMMAEGAGAEVPHVVDLFNRQDGYPTPKVDVRGIVIRDGKILLVREASDGGWTPPGGWADTNASPAENAEREVWEESGFRVRAVKLAAVYDRTLHGHLPAYPFHVYKMFFLCEVLGGEATPSHETPEVGFFAPDELPPLSPGRVTRAQVARMFAHHADATLPTDFDSTRQA